MLPLRRLCSKNEYTKSESNSQPSIVWALIIADCVQRTNIQNLKAIHNSRWPTLTNTFIVFKERIYKIWKQFTTFSNSIYGAGTLCSKNEYTKSESNSQHTDWRYFALCDCVQRTNIQNLKAIHNLVGLSDEDVMIVFKERIYKIWKQFTTINHFRTCSLVLCSKNEYTKSESNSQPESFVMVLAFHCVQRTNIQNLKAIHNAPSTSVPAGDIVFKERIYKIWKQFTTAAGKIVQNAKLCSKNEYTKSESNSQLTSFEDWHEADCVQRTNIQNLKAIHNSRHIQRAKIIIVFKERIYKIWKQFTTYVSEV